MKVENTSSYPSSSVVEIINFAAKELDLGAVAEFELRDHDADLAADAWGEANLVRQDARVILSVAIPANGATPRMVHLNGRHATARYGSLILFADWREFLVHYAASLLFIATIPTAKRRVRDEERLMRRVYEEASLFACKRLSDWWIETGRPALRPVQVISKGGKIAERV